MLRRTLAVAAFASLMTVAAPATHVFACTCMQVTPELALASADAAWVGVVTAADGNDQVRYTFAVEQMVKGEVAIAISVLSPRSSAGCGMEFALAQRWRIFAHTEEGQLRTGLCSGNELLAEGVPSPVPPTAPPPTGLFVAIGSLALVGGLSAWAFTRRPRDESA